MSPLRTARAQPELMDTILSAHSRERGVIRAALDSATWETCRDAHRAIAGKRGQRARRQLIEHAMVRKYKQRREERRTA